jgi:hypothetical protein
MSNTIVELKKLDIDKVVGRLKLSVLANHIVKSLHVMTTRKLQVNTGKCNMHLETMMMLLIRFVTWAEHGLHALPDIVRSPCGPARLEPTIFDGNVCKLRAMSQSH